MNIPEHSESTQAVGPRVDGGVGRLVPERAEDGTLLVLAAAAAGVEHAGWWPTMGALALRDPVGGAWNPLDDDGDALRLAVALGVRCEPMANWCVAYAGSVCAEQFSERSGENRQAAMRRAIVRAAASLGARKTPNAKLTGPSANHWSSK